VLRGARSRELAFSPGINEETGLQPSLGLYAIWLSPFCNSSMRDFGYDVVDILAQTGKNS
jgi:hypothetical protein